MIQSAALMGGDMVRLVALDLVLRFGCGRAARVAFVVKVTGVDFDDRA